MSHQDSTFKGSIHWLREEVHGTIYAVGFVFALGVNVISHIDRGKKFYIHIHTYIHTYIYIYIYIYFMTLYMHQALFLHYNVISHTDYGKNIYIS